MYLVFHKLLKSQEIHIYPFSHSISDLIFSNARKIVPGMEKMLL